MGNKNYPFYDVYYPASVYDMLRNQAKCMPEQIAFRFRKGRNAIEEKSYLQVLKEVEKAASWMVKNYGSGNHAAIIGENSYEWLIAFFALLSSGNVAVPIDKELPANEVGQLIKRADVDIVFVSPTYKDLVEGTEGLKLIDLKELTELGTDADEEYPAFESPADSLACIFFTSGTTGKSKGVMLSHGNIASEIYGPSRLFNPESRSSLVVLPFHHAFGLNVAVLMAYNYGMCVFINRTLKRIKDDLVLAKPEVIMLVPMFTEMFYKQIMNGVRKSGREKKLKNGLFISKILCKLGIDKRRGFFKDIHDIFGGRLKYVISGGAHIDPFYVKKFRDFGIEILNGYGTTECSPCVAINRNYYKRDGSVGQIIEEVQIRISEEGEVLFKGPVTMMGYYKDKESTDEVLKDGWYHTGDLGYVDKDGFLFLTGRIKNLIILSNGENISPEELENDIKIDPGVNDALVYEKDNKIIAEIYPEEEYSGNKAYFNDLMAKVNEGRPAYKQIARTELRDQDFVRNTSKKIIRYKNVPNGQR